MKKNKNLDKKVIQEFGDEWKKFDYENLNQDAILNNFNQYFHIFPWDIIGSSHEGFDMGCGSGRWAQFVAKKVGKLNCIDPSDAIEVAKEKMKNYENVQFWHETTEGCSINSGSQDFGYCLGVLHHIPNTLDALKDCARLLKSGSPFLLYLYYNLDNKPWWYKFLWKISDIFRIIISRMPRILKRPLCDFIALSIYLPLVSVSKIFKFLNFDISNFPLSDYHTKPFYQYRNDALDRFGTRLEQRFSKKEIKEMLTSAGFERISFSESAPFWCSISYKS
jgi:ubiquinone/menaquinone biosynthesis C-methylase UbiE